MTSSRREPGDEFMEKLLLAPLVAGLSAGLTFGIVTSIFSDPFHLTSVDFVYDASTTSLLTTFFAVLFTYFPGGVFVAAGWFLAHLFSNRNLMALRFSFVLVALAFAIFINLGGLDLRWSFRAPYFRWSDLLTWLVTVLVSAEVTARWVSAGYRPAVQSRLASPSETP